MRARRAGTIKQFAAPPRRCDFCGSEFATGKNGKHLYCSLACQRGSSEAERVRLRVSAPIRACAFCGAPVDHRQRSDAAHCSTTCQQAAWYEVEQDRLREAARAWASSNRERRNESEHRRRAKKYGARSEVIDRVEVWESAAGICALCGVGVDATRRHPDPMSASLDHIVPLSRGGEHVRSNIQLTHLRCNLRKGVKVLTAQAVI